MDSSAGSVRKHPRVTSRTLSGHLSAVVATREGRSYLKHSYVQAPLKWSTPMYREDGTLLLMTMDASGGMGDGDVYCTEIRVEEGARLEVRSQAAEKIYPSPNIHLQDRPDNRTLASPDIFSRGTLSFEGERGENTSIVGVVREMKVEVQQGGWLVYAPEPVIPFAASRYWGIQELHLQRRACCAWMEVFSAGRVHKGETFAFWEWRNHLRVYREEELILWENQRWIPEALNLRSGLYFGPYVYLGTFYWFTEGIADSWTKELQEVLMREAHRGMKGYPEQLPLRIGVSRLAHGDLAVKVLGVRADETKRMLQWAWEHCKRNYLPH